MGAASLSLSSFFPHSGKKSTASPCPGDFPKELDPSPPSSTSSSHIQGPTNLPTILEDELGNKENSSTSNLTAVEEYDRAAAIAARKEEAKTRRKKKKKTASSTSLASNTFQELYRLTGEILGQGAYASVQTCVNIYTEVEYAVKIIDKTVKTHSRSRVFKEIDLFHHCQGHHNIINLIEYFEETDKFYLIF